MLEKLQDEFVKMAVAEYPNECGAVLVRFGKQVKLLPVDNIGKPSHLDLIVSQEQIDKLSAGGELVGFVHSHTNGNPEPSPVDKISCEKMGVPWHIFCLPLHTWTTYEPSGFVPPLVGREWVWGVMDCWSLVRDAYRQFGIFLNDYERGPLYYYEGESKRRFIWHKDGWDMFVENCQAEGFTEVRDIQPYDWLLMKYRCTNINHGAILLPGGDILHHMLGARSKVEPWDSNYRKNTCMILRHNQLSQELALTKTLQLY